VEISNTLDLSHKAAARDYYTCFAKLSSVPFDLLFVLSRKAKILQLLQAKRPEPGVISIILSQELVAIGFKLLHFTYNFFEEY